MMTAHLEIQKENIMNISIIGTGNMGQALGTLFSQAGHEVLFGSRHPDATGEVSIVEALEKGEVVVLALPYPAALELTEQDGTRQALAGKVVIDITNPLAPDYMSLTVGHTNSAGEEIANRLPGARVVKAFNTVFADVLKARTAGEAVPVTVFVAGADQVAKTTVLSLAEEIGFAAVDAGALTNARYLEPLTELAIQLAYGQGRGTRIGYQLVSLEAS
jgi:8-hydroxy-5-deazaflavin:NADPH oxidoreductase